MSKAGASGWRWWLFALVPVLLLLTCGLVADAGPRLTGPAVASSVRTVSVPDRGHSRKVLVYRPPVPDNVTLPVVYFLHGVPGSPDDAVTGGVVAGAARLADAGRPFVVAAPDGNGTRSDTEWADSRDGRDRLESFVVGPLIAAVERTNRRPAERRALVGFSMGGYGAANIALHHPMLYGGFASVSGYFTVDDPDGVFGGDPAVERANSPDQHTSDWGGHWAVLVEGSSDRLHLVRGEAPRMAGLLRAAGAAVTLRVVSGGHDIGLVSYALPLVLDKLPPYREPSSRPYKPGSSPRSSAPIRSAAASPATITSEWLSGAPVTPAARLVTRETASTSAPAARAAMASSTVDMPTRSAPSVRSMAISAGVSNCGPGMPA